MGKRFSKAISLLSVLMITSCSTYSPSTYLVNSRLIDGHIITPFNTSISIKLPNSSVAKKLTPLFEEDVWKYHYLCDSHYNYGDIHNIKYINEHLNENIVIDKDLYDLIDFGVKLTKLSKGTFNIALGSVIDIWEDKFNEDNIVSDVDASLINEALKAVPNYSNIDNVIILNKNESSIKIDNSSLENKNVRLSIGSLAKGFTIDHLNNKFNSEHILVNMGNSSIKTFNTNPNTLKDNWTIGLQNPIAKSDDYIVTLEFNNTLNMSTSGDYQKYFDIDIDGQKIRRHHILNGLTGYPLNYHHLINVVSSDEHSSMYLDGLSTCLFNLEHLDEINSFVDSFKQEFNLSELGYMVFDNNANMNDEYQKYVKKI